MPKRAISLLVTLTLFFGLFGNVSPAHSATASLREGSDKAASLFDPLRPIRVSVIRELGGPALTRNYLNSPTYRRATVKINLYGSNKYVVIKNVGVRLKGSFTSRFQKMSLKIKFDAFVKKQEFKGLKRLTLNAMMQDPSQVHEVTAYRLFRAAGIAAPRAGYAKVRIDGSYMGLYLNLESIDSKMLERWFPNTEHLYSGPRPCDLTPGNSCYVANTGTTDRTDLAKISRLHSLSGKDWWKELSKTTDINRLMTFLATEIFLSHWDGYGDFMRNNHYVHFDKDGKFTLIPWGTDQTFPWESKHLLTWNASKPVYISDSTERSSIITHCLAYNPCQDKLLQAGLRISKLSKKIDLAGYSQKVIQRINQRQYSKNDTNKVPAKTRQMEQEWIATYLNQSERSLINFLKIRRPSRLDAKLVTPLTVGKKAVAQVETFWEPGVTAQYQWFNGSKPIEGARSRSLKLSSDFAGDRLKLRITLKKDGVADTVYFTRSHKVRAK
jgi:hypothetical protein